MKNIYIIIGLIIIIVSIGTFENLSFLEETDNDKYEEPFYFSDNPDKLDEYHYLIRHRDKELKGRLYGTNYKLKELFKLEQNKRGQSRGQAITWVERGPGNVPGRTRGLLVLDEDADKNSWFAGSASGGIWKTTDAGASWKLKTPDFPNLSTTVLAKSASSDNIIYAGTGEFFNSIGGVDGDGMFKSTDGGETWSQIISTAINSDFRNVFRIIVDPNDPNILLAAVSETGSKIFQADLRCTIYKSVDAGATWVEKYMTNKRIQDLKFDPSNYNNQYASINGTGVLKSVDGGETWVLKGTEILTSGRIELAIAPSNPNRLYASVQGVVSNAIGASNPTGTNGSDLYTSLDAGETWELLLEENNGINHNFLDGQGGYDNTIVVNPYDENDIYVGGVDLFNMKVKTAAIPIPTIGNVDTTNVGFINFIYFSASFFGGILETGNNNQAVNLVNADFVDVEFRFGVDKSQMAHRFSIKPGSGANGDDGAGVAPNGYLYEDYVEVPFEVWDVTNNKQLMASFRDQENDGNWDLEERDDNDGTVGREYFFVNGVDYNAVMPDVNIAKDGGHSYKQLYFMWPTLASGEIFNPLNLPDATINIHTKQLQTRNRKTLPISDSRAQYDGRNASNQTFGETVQKDLHPDHHNLIAIPVDNGAQTFKLLNSNDGGVFVSNTSSEPGVNDGDWTFSGTGYNTSQFYGVDKKPGALEFIGGMQDNGSWRSPKDQEATSSSSYVRQVTGDGFEAVWHYGDKNLVIASSQGNNFRKSTDEGRSWNSATSGFTETSSPFISKLESSKNNPDILYSVGSQGVWKSADFADNWVLKPINDNWAEPSFVNVMDVKTSISNHQIVWAGGGMTSQSNMHVSTNGGETFSPTSNFQPINLLGRISGLETHPTEDSTAFVLFSFASGPKIIRTQDLGTSWEELSGFGSGLTSSNGFPNVAVYTLLVMPYNTNTIWVGTEIGVIESTDNGLNWHLLNSDLPAVSIWELKIVDDEVVAASHGRGIWTANISDINKQPFITSYNKIEGMPPVLDINMRTAYDSVLVYANNQILLKIFPSEVGIMNVELPINVDGSYKFYAISFINGVGYKSSSSTLDVVVKKVVLAISESDLEKRFTIYPNPVQKGGRISISFGGNDSNQDQIKINVYTQEGKLIYSKPGLSLKKEMEFKAPIIPGIYLINILAGNKILGQSKILVTQ